MGWQARRSWSMATHYDYRFTNIEHVSGACQLFRRACFEEIGGYFPIKGGGIDWTAVTTARMIGWQTRTFTDKTCLHHRPMGTGERESASRPLPARPEGLLPRRTPTLAGLPERLPADAVAVRDRRTHTARGLLLGRAAAA